MKKSLIAAAALTAMAGAAQAQVSIYGLIDLSYGKSLIDGFKIDGEKAYFDCESGYYVLDDRKADFHSGGDSCSSQGNSTSRVGLKGSLDVGGGTKVNFRLETSGIQSDGELNGAFFGRQMWAGFSGGFGEVRLGRQDSVPFQTMIDFDFNGASNGVSSGAYTRVGAFYPGRQNRSLQYITPSMGGLSAQFGFQPKGNEQDGDKSVFSAGLKFGSGPLTVGAAMETKRDSDTRGFWSVAGSYDFGVAKAMLSYANGGDPDKGGNGRGWGVGAVAPLAGINVGFIYHRNSKGWVESVTFLDPSDSSLNEFGNVRFDRVSSWELFANKEIFKGTYLYGEYGRWKARVDGGEGAASAKSNGFAVGVIFTF